MSGRWLFMDMNSFYSSVEQQRSPHLRRRPVIVVPIANTEATCAIAASYEAKACGIKTGCGVREARELCPNVRVVQARPALYLEYHARILEILDEKFVTVRPLSVDEMACKISGHYDTREAEITLAEEIKRLLRKR